MPSKTLISPERTQQTLTSLGNFLDSIMNLQPSLTSLQSLEWARLRSVLFQTSNLMTSEIAGGLAFKLHLGSNSYLLSIRLSMLEGNGDSPLSFNLTSIEQ